MTVSHGRHGGLAKGHPRPWRTALRHASCPSGPTPHGTPLPVHSLPHLTLCLLAALPLCLDPGIFCVTSNCHFMYAIARDIPALRWVAHVNPHTKTTINSIIGEGATLQCNAQHSCSQQPWKHLVC